MDNYVPEKVQLPTLIVCNEITTAFDESFLEDNGLPRTMFNLQPLNFDIINTTKPFPNLDETWDMVTLDLNVNSRTYPNESGVTVSKVNTLWQGRCLKIENGKPYPGGKRISSEIKIKAGNFVGASISVSFVYDVDITGIIVDYSSVPYHNVIISNGTLKYLTYG